MNAALKEPTALVASYERTMGELLEKRATKGTLSQDEEASYATRLSDLHEQMSPEEEEQIEQLVAKRLEAKA